LQEAGFLTVTNRDESYSLIVKKEDHIDTRTTHTSVPVFNIPEPNFGDEKLSRYTFMSSSEQEVDHLLIRTQFFKLKS
jgi:hypothetical protein